MQFLSAVLLQSSIVVFAAPSLRRLGKHAEGSHQSLNADKGKGDAHNAVTIMLTNHDGMQYSGPVTVGGQHLRAIYDTGSIEIMIVSEHCKTCHIPEELSIFSSSQSKTFRSGTGSIVPHHYAGVVVEARQDFDTVSIGDSPSQMIAVGMPIWQVVETDLPQWTNPKYCKFTTILGLGHKESITNGSEVEHSALQVLEQVGTRRFGICLQKGAANPGYITFNPPVSADLASFHSVPVVGKRHWAVHQDEVSFDNGKWVDRRCSGADTCVAIVDSGTSLIGVPAMHMAFVSGLVQKMRPDCSNLDELPDLVFRLGGHDFALSSSSYVMQLPSEDGSKRCYGAFMELSMESDMGGLVWVLGLPFLRQFYTIWDREEPAIYISGQSDGCEVPSSKFMVNVNDNRTASKFAHSVGHRREPTIGNSTNARLPSWALDVGQRLQI